METADARGSASARWYERLISRRDLFRRLGWGGIATFLAGSGIATARLFYPRVLFEPPARFKAGRPSAYPPGTVNTEYKDKYRVWIVRQEDGRFFCLFARCTHLGCTPNWKSSEGVFHCPCHGSKFDRSGVNSAGPAPRPLDRFKITLAPDGQLLVDRSIVFKGIAGENLDALYPQSLLEV